VRRPLMLRLCLIAALLGPPLRQAEAADDLARTIAEFGIGPIVETIDGGVGDDLDEAVLQAGADIQPIPAAVLPIAPEWNITPLLPAVTPPGSRDRLRADWTPSLPADSARRHAWLQCFLF